MPVAGRWYSAYAYEAPTRKGKDYIAIKIPRKRNFFVIIQEPKLTRHYMGEYRTGERIALRGPSTPPDKNDVEGEVVEVRDDGIVMVQEDKYEDPTPVNPNGGWLRDK